MVLNQDSSIKLLNTIEEKTTLLECYGIDALIIHPFDAAFSNLTAEEFVNSVLVNQLNVQKKNNWHDHRFGKNRTANIDDLINFGQNIILMLSKLAQEIDEIAISSTKIRKALLEGNITLESIF